MLVKIYVTKDFKENRDSEVYTGQIPQLPEIWQNIAANGRYTVWKVVQILDSDKIDAEIFVKSLSKV